LQGSSEYMYMNYHNCPLSRNICVTKVIIFVNIGKFRINQKNNTPK